MAVSKPLPGQRIDRTAPLAQNIAAFWPFNEGGGSRVNDVVGRRNASGTANAVQWRGAGGAFVSTSYVQIPVGAIPVQKTTKFSGIVRASLTATTGALISNWNVAASGGWQFILYPSGNIGFWMGSQAAGAYISAVSTAAYNDGKPHTFGWDYDGSVSASGIVIYVDGVRVASTPTSAGDPGTLTDYGVRIGLKTDSQYPFVGTYEHSGIWLGGNLGAAGHAAIAQNPWQLWPDEPQLVFAPASGVTGTSSATLTTTGTATGAVAVAAASSQTLPVTGASTGAVAVAGASAGTIPLTGTAAGAAAVAGASSSTVDLAGTATGAAAVAGASSATVDLGGTATGTIPPLAVSGDSAVTVDLAGTAAGAVAVAGASTGTINTTGTAAATNPVAGASDATLAITGSAAGAVAVAGASAVTISTTGSATGEVQNFAAVSDGTFTLAGTAAGTVAVAGASAQQIEVAGAAAFTIRNILGASAGRVQTSASRTEALNSADRQNTYNPARIAAGNGKRGSNVQTGKR